jgi:glutamate-5-semialdehyde dehydrogenase
MSVIELARAARAASRQLATRDHGMRNRALLAAAERLEARERTILEANRNDCEAAVDLAPATLQRLRVDAGKLRDMVRGLREVAELPDPLGRVRLRRILDDGLELTQVTCPLGVLAVIFESRPDALVQIGALAVKSGNAALLKGGREAAATNRELAGCLREGLAEAGLPEAALQLLRGREEVDALLGLDDLVDLVIPRGSSALVRAIQSRTKIPVLGHAEGICHVYVDVAADPAMAVALVRDAKLQYPAACNAAETLLVHSGALEALDRVVADLLRQGVELRGCPRCRERFPDLVPAGEQDWDLEYGDRILAVRLVDSLDEAIAHIHAHGSGHTEAIITEDAAAAARFLAEVDAAGVYHNASTRFADGYRYGFGAEVGISTGRIHARGPVGLEGLVSTKYLLRGHGHRVAEYSGPDARPFLHRDL